MADLVIWAQSECRSTMALYREVKRQAGVPVTVVVRRDATEGWVRRLRESQGQPEAAFADVVDLYWDGLEASGRGIFSSHSGRGSVHVFSGYQVSSAVRAMVAIAHASGLKTVVYDEAPCPMCTGIKAAAKRLYYRFFLPWRARKTARTADLFLNASGRGGVDDLIRLGWDKAKIIPFGYATQCGQNVVGMGGSRNSRHFIGSRVQIPPPDESNSLHILHTGAESPNRGIVTLIRAVAALENRGINVEVKFTGGKVTPDEMPALYKWADVFVACGLCEPWGMRVNDAIHAGLPVVVSNGMGAAWLVEQFGCGCVYEKGNVAELADILSRFATDPIFYDGLLSGVKAAHNAWTPEARASAFLEAVKA